MDRSQGFLQQPIDRTPYGACAGVAAVVIVLFFLAGWALWGLAARVKQAHWSFAGFSLPSTTLPTNVGSQVQKTLNNAANSAAQSAASAAVQAGKNAATQQEQGLQNSLQNNLK